LIFIKCAFESFPKLFVTFLLLYILYIIA
jgi:hypothetical protein